MKEPSTPNQTTSDDFPKPRQNPGGEPCGECHLKPGETCDICGAVSKTTEERALAEGWDKSGIGYGEGTATMTGLPPDPLGVWFDSIPASIKRKLSLDDLMKLWRLANEAVGVKQ
jgi:hypothetical protein